MSDTEDLLKLIGLLVVLIIVFPAIGFAILRTMIEMTFLILILVFIAIFGLIIWFILKDHL